MRKITRAQKIKEIESNKDASRGEQSPYWDYMESRSSDHSNFEAAQANPDVLSETEVSAPSTPQLLLGEAIMHLQGRQKECYLLVMREDKSLAEAAEILGIAKGSVQVYVDRAVKFLTQYCKAAIKKGRV